MADPLCPEEVHAPDLMAALQESLKTAPGGCEACWSQAYVESRFRTGENQFQAYKRLLAENQEAHLRAERAERLHDLCDVCGKEYGGSHWHCGSCGAETGMVGHQTCLDVDPEQGIDGAEQ